MLTVAFTTGEQMKEQYLGDVSDYGKYALLRRLTAGSDLRLGVCWMLTPDDGGPDGRKLGYLRAPNRWRPHDSPVFDLLKQVVSRPESRRLIAIEQSGVLRQSDFFEEHLPDDLAGRAKYMAGAIQRLAACNLVFFDPDNGIEVALAKGRKNSSKYLYVDEAAAFWATGASLLVYQHYPMVKKSVFEARVANRLAAALPGSQILLFATAHVLFVLAAQPRHVAHFAQAADMIAAKWPKGFVELRPTPTPDHNPPPQSAVTSVTAYTRKAAVHDDICEARVPGGAWVQIGIAEAIERRGFVDLRCVECHGRVRAHRAADGSFRAHFEHAQRHAGCSRSPGYSGTQTRHPTAIE